MSTRTTCIAAAVATTLGTAGMLATHILGYDIGSAWWSARILVLLAAVFFAWATMLYADYTGSDLKFVVINGFIAAALAATGAFLERQVLQANLSYAQARIWSVTNYPSQPDAQSQRKQANIVLGTSGYAHTGFWLLLAAAAVLLGVSVTGAVTIRREARMRQSIRLSRSVG